MDYVRNHNYNTRFPLQDQLMQLYKMWKQMYIKDLKIKRDQQKSDYLYQ